MTANFVFNHKAEATSCTETGSELGVQSYVSARLLESGHGGSELELEGGSSTLQLSPGKTPARGQAGDSGNKGGRGRMQSWKNPSGRRRGGGAPGSRSI